MNLSIVVNDNFNGFKYNIKFSELALFKKLDTFEIGFLQNAFY